MSDKITVVIVVTDVRESFLYRALSRLEAEGHNDFEFIVIHDGENNAHSVLSYDFGAIGIKTTSINLHEVLDWGFGLATGKYICWQRDIDFIPESRFAYQVRCLETNSKLSAVCGHAAIVDWEEKYKDIVIPRENDTHTMLFHRDSFMALGGFSDGKPWESARKAGDVLLSDKVVYLINNQEKNYNEKFYFSI